ncbi:hypothetical protein B0920_05295 [Massilia sp. KIM]|nr:hypothetical protein B0920_05295 [Massilia sp. KIM]
MWLQRGQFRMKVGFYAVDKLCNQPTIFTRHNLTRHERHRCVKGLTPVQAVIYINEVKRNIVLKLSRLDTSNEIAQIRSGFFMYSFFLSICDFYIYLALLTYKSQIRRLAGGPCDEVGRQSKGI